MSRQARDWCADFDLGDGTLKQVLRELADFADADGRAYPMQETLARRCNRTVRTISAALHELAHRGLIAIRTRGRSGTEYILKMEAKATRAKPNGAADHHGMNGVDNRKTLPVKRQAKPENASGHAGALTGNPRTFNRKSTTQQPSDTLCLVNQESNQESPPTPPQAGGLGFQPEEIFEKFFALYPKKDAKDHARKAFLRAVSRGADPEDIAAGCQLCVEYGTLDPRDFGRYCQPAATWLNRSQWNDWHTRAQAMLAEAERAGRN